MNKIKSTKGITLISLMVTIIILLILAGVSIDTLTGNNGLLNRAKDAKIATEIAGIKEKIQIDILGEEEWNNGNISDDTLKGILEKYGVLSKEGEKLIDKTLTTTKGNYEIKVSDIFNGTTVKDVPENPTFTTVANAPDIEGFDRTKTYYVAWNKNEGGTAYNPDERKMSENVAPDNWYDYTAGVNHWANVKTTGGGNDCYWVWIPRYAYCITEGYQSNTAGTIDIKFLRGTSNTPIDGSSITISNTSGSGNWNVHPAFTNAGNGGFGELTGIWVAKFEASSSNVSVETLETDLATTGGGNTNSLKVRVKPNVTSWRAISVGEIFTVCKNITTTGNSLEGTTNIDSHMMKNTEWGAVAYLSRSQYGKNSAVYNNPYWNDNDYNGTKYYSPITGLCGKTQNYATETYNDPNVYKYNTTEGKNASTTGNVYGVYDMAGGAWEYVAAVLSTKKSSGSYYNFTNIDTKYYESYDAYDNSKYGDAMYETSMNSEGSTSWDGDYSSFVTESDPVFVRGGHAFNWDPAGVFAFYRYSGGTNATRSFRPCLVSPQ